MQHVFIELAELEQIITRIVDKAVGGLVLSNASEQNPEVLLNAKQAAKLLNVSLSSLHAYKRQGTLKFRRIGRRVFFIESEILESLKKIN